MEDETTVLGKQLFSNNIHFMGKASCYQANNCSVEPYQSFSQQKQAVLCGYMLQIAGFLLFDTVHFTDCDTVYDVTIICQYSINNSDSTLSNVLSDVDIMHVSKDYMRINYSQSCSRGWIRIGQVCVNIFNCPLCLQENDAHIHVCSSKGAALASRVFQEEEFSSIIKDNIIRISPNVSSALMMFLSSFSDNNGYDIIYIAINSSFLCHMYNHSLPCKIALETLH